MATKKRHDEMAGELMEIGGLDTRTTASVVEEVVGLDHPFADVAVAALTPHTVHPEDGGDDSHVIAQASSLELDGAVQPPPDGGHEPPKTEQVYPKKPKPTKAERRAKQDKQRAAKALRLAERKIGTDDGFAKAAGASAVSTSVETTKALKRAIDAARVRKSSVGSEARLPLKVDKDGYTPQCGITCVMNPTPETIDLFGRPMHDRLSADPTLHCFLPLPPHAFHVTLVPLEFASVLVGGLAVEDIARQLAVAQEQLDRTIVGEVHFVPETRGRGGKALAMTPSPPSLEVHLRTAERTLKTFVSVPRDKLQSWHMSLGYFRSGTTEDERLAGAARIGDVAREVLREVLNENRPAFTFLPPAICVYADHTHYVPLFR